jgi:predicted dehydrogenase
VHGFSGSLFGGADTRWLGEYRPELLVRTDTVTTTYQFPQTDALKDEIGDFDCCLTEGGQPLAAGMDGLRATEISLALFESGRQGRAIRTRPFVARPTIRQVLNRSSASAAFERQAEM